MVNVRGVNFPAYIDQLDFPYFKNFTEKKLFPEKKAKKYIDDVRKEKAPQQKVVDGIWLSFLPVMETDEFGDDYGANTKNSSAEQNRIEGIILITFFNFLAERV